LSLFRYCHPPHRHSFLHDALPIYTLVTAFFNERTVLFASYNNHPIDGVVEKLQNLTYRGRTIPFPILRLGNSERTAAALDTIRQARKSPRLNSSHVAISYAVHRLK